MHDVTEQEQRKTELARYEQLLEAISDPIWVYDTSKTVTFANHELTERLPMARNNVVGQPLEIFSEFFADPAVAATWESLVTDNELQFEADTDRLEQLLENLFRNAVDHNRPDVTVRIGALEDETGFYVEDNGTGIPENEREQVFELGHSTDSNGTGFGLAIVAEIAAAHDWSITATESGNGGARFEVTTGEIAPNLPY